MASKTPIVVFDHAPPRGYKLRDGAFCYEVLETRPHTTRSGEASLVITWRGLCAHDGEPFEFTTGRNVWNLRRRCEVHSLGMTRAIPYVRLPQPATGAPVDPVDHFADALQAHLTKEKHFQAAADVWVFLDKWRRYLKEQADAAAARAMFE